MAASPAEQCQDDALVRLLTCSDTDALIKAAAVAGTQPGAPRLAALYRLAEYRLQLVASAGIPPEILDRYRVMSVDSALPVAEAVRERRTVYATAGDFPRAAAPGGRHAWGTTEEFVCLPLTVDRETLGVLCLLLPTDATLSADRRWRLHAVATACALRWARLLDRGDAPPATEEFAYDDTAEDDQEVVLPLATGRGRVAMLELAMSNANIGSFDWDFATGRLVWDERLCELFGIKPDAFDGRIETFLRAVHPEDRERVDAAVRESHRTGRYHVVYRIVQPDGAVRWIDAESRVVYADDGEPQGMIGVAQDRTEELEQQSARAARRRFVLDLTHALSAALSTEDIFHALADITLPALDAASVAVILRERGGRAELLGERGFGERGLQRLRAAVTAAAGDPRLQQLREGHPLFLESRREYRAAMPPGVPEPDPAVHACALLPLTSADGFLGTCVLLYDRPHAFSPEDRTVLTAAGGILGQSLARARLYDTRRRYLTDLQQLMLPRRLPEVPGLEIAFRYLPGSEGLEVGGDWYDVLPRPDGRVALVIGDVQGHSAPAAGVMGQLRTAMRTYAAEGHGPVTLMQRGNQALRDLDTELFATCCVAEIDPADGRARLVRAGHPYPVLLEPDGRARELDVPGGMPLGTFPEDAYPVTVVTLAAGSTLLLYTDGLVERHDLGYEQAVAELAERLAAEADPSRDLGETARRITEQAARSQHDDIAVLLVRRTADQQHPR